MISIITSNLIFARVFNSSIIRAIRGHSLPAPIGGVNDFCGIFKQSLVRLWKSPYKLYALFSWDTCVEVRQLQLPGGVYDGIREIMIMIIFE